MLEIFDNIFGLMRDGHPSLADVFGGERLLFIMTLFIIWASGYYFLLRKTNQFITSIPVSMIAVMMIFTSPGTILAFWKFFIVWAAVLSAVQTRRLTVFFYWNAAVFLILTAIFLSDYNRICAQYIFAQDWLLKKKNWQWTIATMAFLPAAILFLTHSYNAAVLRRSPSQTDNSKQAHGAVHALLALVIVIVCFMAAPYWVFNFVPREYASKNRRRPSGIRSDMRSLATAIEAYQADNGDYPAWSISIRPESINSGVNNLTEIYAYQTTFTRCWPSGPRTLTTPIGYITSYPRDGFARPSVTFSYYAATETSYKGWILWSPGPDGYYHITWPSVKRLYNPAMPQPSEALLYLAYDPTNGAYSAGDVWRIKQ